jgi:hypothetical protein
VHPTAVITSTLHSGVGLFSDEGGLARLIARDSKSSAICNELPLMPTSEFSFNLIEQRLSTFSSALLLLVSFVESLELLPAVENFRSS